MCDEEFFSELAFISAGLILLRHSIESGDVPADTIVQALDGWRAHLDRIVSDWEMQGQQVAVEAKENQLSGLKQNTVSSNLKKREEPIISAKKAAESIGVSENTYRDMKQCRNKQKSLYRGASSNKYENMLANNDKNYHMNFQDLEDEIVNIVSAAMDSVFSSINNYKQQGITATEKSIENIREKFSMLIATMKEMEEQNDGYNRKPNHEVTGRS